jgi:hypothetical protein
MPMSPRAGLRLALLLSLSATPSAAEDETLLGCRAIEGSEERLACYDRVVDRVNREIAPGVPATEPRVSSSERPAAEPPSSEAPEDRTLRERLFGRSASESATALRRTYGIETPNEIASKVADAKRMGDKTYQIALENGQVWRQVEAVHFVVKSGDTVEIEAGLAGSYYLRRNGAGRTIRVKRIQ